MSLGVGALPAACYCALVFAYYEKLPHVMRGPVAAGAAVLLLGGYASLAATKLREEPRGLRIARRVAAGALALYFLLALTGGVTMRDPQAHDALAMAGYAALACGFEVAALPLLGYYALSAVERAADADGLQALARAGLATYQLRELADYAHLKARPKDPQKDKTP